VIPAARQPVAGISGFYFPNVEIICIKS
jgi:hypothetical protein